MADLITVIQPNLSRKLITRKEWEKMMTEENETQEEPKEEPKEE